MLLLKYLVKGLPHPAQSPSAAQMDPPEKASNKPVGLCWVFAASHPLHPLSSSLFPFLNKHRTRMVITDLWVKILIHQIKSQ